MSATVMSPSGSAVHYIFHITIVLSDYLLPRKRRIKRERTEGNETFARLDNLVFSFLPPARQAPFLLPQSKIRIPSSVLALAKGDTLQAPILCKAKRKKHSAKNSPRKHDTRNHVRERVCLCGCVRECGRSCSPRQ